MVVWDLPFEHFMLVHISISLVFQNSPLSQDHPIKLLPNENAYVQNTIAYIFDSQLHMNGEHV